MLLLTLIVAAGGLTLRVDAYRLTLLHTNDVHSRFQEFNVRGGICSNYERDNKACFGGFARLANKTKELKNRYPNTLLVDAGNQFQGTLWYYVYKWKAAAHFMNQLNYDAMTLGTHEFDGGISGLVPFMGNITFPVVSSNINASMEPRMSGLLKRSVIVMRGGEKIGLVGYTTPETPELRDTGKLQFDDILTSLKAEVKKLTDQGVNKIVALGHAGYDVDKQLAKQVSGLDVIVGGGSNTFLSVNGTRPSVEIPQGSYPTEITQANGNKVLVVQDFAYGKYLGFLYVDFDRHGQVVSWGKNPILLDETIAQDSGMLSDINKWATKVDNVLTKVVGKSRYALKADQCSEKECNLGNLLAEACVQRIVQFPDGVRWRDVSIAMINGPSINSSLPAGDITIGNIVKAWPYQNTFDIVEIKGSVIRQILENAVTNYLSKPRMIQVAGLRVQFDKNKAAQKRVAWIEVRCASCSVPEFKPLDDNQVYKVIMSAYMISGGYGFNMIKGNIIKHNTIGDLDIEIVTDYVTKVSPITTGLDKRIRFVENQVCYSLNNAAKVTMQSIFFYIFAAVLSSYFFI